jgi:hypothetical protein
MRYLPQCPWGQILATSTPTPRTMPEHVSFEQESNVKASDTTIQICMDYQIKKQLYVLKSHLFIIRWRNIYNILIIIKPIIPVTSLRMDPYRMQLYTV